MNAQLPESSVLLLFGGFAFFFCLKWYWPSETFHTKMQQGEGCPAQQYVYKALSTAPECIVTLHFFILWTGWTMKQAPEGTVSSSGGHARGAVIRKKSKTLGKQRWNRKGVEEEGE